MKERLLVHFLELAGESRIIDWRCRLHREKIIKIMETLQAPDGSLMEEFNGSIPDREQKRIDKHQKAISSMQGHKKSVVEAHSRSAHIAYCFLKGRAYNRIENKAKSQPNWLEVQKFVLKFWDRDKFKDYSDVLSAFQTWLIQAETWYRCNRFGNNTYWEDYYFERNFKNQEPLVKELVAARTPTEDKKEEVNAA